MDDHPLRAQDNAVFTLPPRAATLAGVVTTENLSGGLCEFCSSIPWQQFSSPFENRFLVRFVSSSCRLCRFFAEMRRTHRITKSPFSCISRPQSTYIGFAGDFEYCSSLQAEIYDSPMLIISHDGEEAKSNLQCLYPQQIDFSVIKNWIQACKHQHSVSCCPDSLNRILDLKVIDCEARIITSLPRGSEFLALSYVWGKSASGSLPETQSLPDDLPPTIEDSLTTTLALGFRYIWIDRYCIDQQNEDEKHKLIRKMGNIYAAAQVTLIAAAGDSPDHGLPGVRPLARTADLKSMSIGSISLFMHPTAGISDIENSTWATRGWTFQEGYFSKRRLLFTDRQVIWICNMEAHYETIQPIQSKWSSSPIGFLSGYLPFRLELDGTLESFNWRTGRLTCTSFKESKTILRSYSRRHLTYDSDALDAVAGALERLSEIKSNMFHIWAIPLIRQRVRHPFHCSMDYVEESVEVIQIALNWHHREPCRRRLEFPSWSLLGWTSPIEWAEESPFIEARKLMFWDGDDRFQIPEIVTSYQHEELAFRRIIVTGKVCQVSLAYTSDHLLHYYTVIPITADLSLLVSTRWDQDPAELTSTDGMICLLLGRVDMSPLFTSVGSNQTMIVMIPIDGIYCRVGLFSPNNWEEGNESSRIILRQLRNEEYVWPDEEDRETLLAEHGVDVASWYRETFRERTIIMG